MIIINTNRQNIIALATPCVSPRSGNVTSNAHAQRKWPAGFPSTSDASSVISLHHRIETVGTGDTFVSTHSFLSVWWYIADGVVGRCWHCLLALLFVRIISDYLVPDFLFKSDFRPPFLAATAWIPLFLVFVFRLTSCGPQLRHVSRSNLHHVILKFQWFHLRAKERRQNKRVLEITDWTLIWRIFLKNFVLELCMRMSHITSRSKQ